MIYSSEALDFVSFLAETQLGPQLRRSPALSEVFPSQLAAAKISLSYLCTWDSSSMSD